MTERCFYCMQPFAPYGPLMKYALDEHRNKVCYDCCAWLDVIAMMQGKPIALYHDDNGNISNWPGTLLMAKRAKRDGRHNMAGKRTTYYFSGPLGTLWSGVEYHGICSGNLLRQVRRLKQKESFT